MIKIIDLHIHSNFSEDADLSVDEIFRLASNSTLSAISITDHDSINSIGEAKKIKKKYNIEYIPGVEITTVFPVDGSQQHILGYFVDDKNPFLLEALNTIKESRILVTKKRINKLKKIGFALNEERVWEMAGERPPGATSIMLEIFKNEGNSDNEKLYEYLHGAKKNNRLSLFYREYLVDGKSAYIPFQSINVEDGVDVIKKAGGIPVLAHPKFLKKKEWLDVIRDYGIQGIEAISTYHTREDIKFYQDYAFKHDLIITAGSDFHGPTAKPKVKLGGIEGNDYSFFQKLIDLHISRDKSP